MERVHCLLPGGEVLVAGGTAHYEKDADPAHAEFGHFTGIPSVIIFGRDELWHPARPMSEGRWYPTCITLADGRVLVLSGHPSDKAGPHENTLIEIFDPVDGTWTAPFATQPPLEDTGGVSSILGKQIRPEVYYPRLHQLPDGRIFSSTPLRVGGVRRTRALEVAGHSTTDLGPPPPFGDDPLEPVNIYARSAFASVLLPLVPPSYGARILICGHRQPLFFEPNNPHLGWREAGQRPADPPGTLRLPPNRAYANAVLLPDGTVLVVGGADSERLPPPIGGGADSSAVHFVERYFPQTNFWERLGESPIARVYHSVALLLPDGRVWVAGSNHDSDRNHGGKRLDNPGLGDARELRIEVYSPPYLFTIDAEGKTVPANRPTISNLVSRAGQDQAREPVGAGHDQLLRVRAPDASEITAVHLIRCSSATHAFDPDQRLVVLQIVSRDAQSLVVRMPPNGAVAPPGYYLLFVLDGHATPSVGRFLRLSPTYPLAEVYLGRPLTTIDVPDLPVGADATVIPFPVLDLETLVLGQTRRALVRCKNVGTGGLRILGSDLSGAFRTQDEPGSPTLGTRDRPKNVEVVVLGSPAQEDSYAELELRFTPTEVGDHLGTLTVHTNAPDLGAFFVALRGHVRGFDAELLAAEPPADEVQFGNVPVGSSAVRTVTVRNQGNVDVFVDDLVVEDGPGQSAFAVPAVIPQRSVPAGESRDFSVFFSPLAVEHERAQLAVLVEGVPAPSGFSRRLTIGLSGVGTGPQISVEPDALAFSSQLIRTASAPQQITVRNTGSAPLHITNILPSLDWRLEIQVPRTEILPGAAVQLAVVFRPGSSGPLTGTLVVDSDAPSGPARVTLEGEGVAAPIPLLTPTALNFGNQAVGTHGLARSLTVMNDGAADLQITSIGVSGAASGDFHITGDSCSGATLQPEGTCGIDVLFTPTAAGTRDAELEIVDNGAGSPRTVALVGTADPAPRLTINPTQLLFPDQTIGSSSQTQRVIVTNNGRDALTVARVDTTGAAARDFTIAQTTCLDGMLAPAGSCVVDLVFEPAAAGIREATLVVTDDTPGPPSAVPLTGVGLASDVRFEPIELSFESQLVGTFSPRQDVLLNNTGNAPLNIAELTVIGDFQFDHSCGAVVSPGGFCRIRVIFSPVAGGVRSGEVRVLDDVGNVHVLPLEGFGAVPQAALSSDSIAFVDQGVGSTSNPQSVRLTNVGTGVLVVTQADLELGSSSEFTKDADSFTGAVLRHAESCTLSLSFAPRSLGPHSDTLRVVTNASDSPHRIRLSGLGT
jgi:hypothetical protein